jgi:RNA polymerase-binding transcription factor DksA
MATPRKSKAATGKRKAASPARHPAAPRKTKPLARKPESHAAKGTAPRPAAKKDARPAAAEKQAPKGRTAASKRSAAPPPPVRPLGVLPASSMSKAKERPAVPPVAPAKPAARKAAARPETVEAQPLTAKDYKHFEELLMAELQKIRREMGHLENTVLKVNPRDSSGDLSGYSFHMADAGTDAMEREKAFLFASVEGRRELEIRAALQRIYEGTFGVCEECGQPISRARLEAMSSVRLCLSCKQKEEQASRSQPG